YALNKAKAALDVKAGLAVVRKPILNARQEFLQRRTKENTRALNERRVDEFLAALPEVEYTSHLTRNAIDRYALLLEEAGHNSGGVQHHLRIVRAFCKFCFDQQWVADYAFKGFVMPESDFEGRPLTEAEATRIMEPTRGARLIVFKEFDKRRGTFR